ncbi:MAG: hypothetical protein KAQ92_01265 [Candidatus Aenigmarchaeota archaeon]|nr:hypothetical protein [Candidatus Aenigmarchaeota archaeon]
MEELKKELKKVIKKIEKQKKNILTSISKESNKLISVINKPWFKDKKIILPFILTILISILISSYIGNHFSEKTDAVLDEIKNITTNTNKIVNVLSGKGNSSINDIPSQITIKTTKESITPDGSILFWIALNKPKDVYQKGYIFDIGDSYVKNRMSLFVDKNSFLSWRIIDNDYNIHILRSDIDKYINGTYFHVCLTWEQEGELNIYVNGLSASNIKLDELNLDISSHEMYWGSDINKEYIINFN